MRRSVEEFRSRLVKPTRPQSDFEIESYSPEYFILILCYNVQRSLEEFRSRVVKLTLQYSDFIVESYSLEYSILIQFCATIWESLTLFLVGKSNYFTPNEIMRLDFTIYIAMLTALYL